MVKSTRKYTAVVKGLVLLIMLFLYNACESVLFIELDEADKLIVVNGAITNDDTLAIQVSRTRHILDNAPVVPLEDAKVNLFQGGAFVEELEYRENGLYMATGGFPLVGETYFIEVERAGYPSVAAACEIPEAVPIRKLDTTSVIIEYEDHYSYGYTEHFLQFDLTLDDPPGEDNYYLLSAEADRTWTDVRDTMVRVVDSLWYNNQWNYFLEDSTYTIYDIIRYTDIPFISSSDIVVEAFTSNGILFSDQVIDGKSYSFRGEFYAHQLSSSDSTILDIRLHSISESYYKYLKSRQHHYETKENYLAVPVIVYSNVEDGAGFFGGYSTDEYTITTFISEFRDYWYYEY